MFLVDQVSQQPSEMAMAISFFHQLMENSNEQTNEAMQTLFSQMEIFNQQRQEGAQALSRRMSLQQSSIAHLDSELSQSLRVHQEAREAFNQREQESQNSLALANQREAELQNQINALMNRQAEERAAFSQQVASLQSEKLTLESRVSQLEGQNADQTQQMSNLTNLFQAVQQEKTVSDQQILQLQSQVGTLSQEKTHLEISLDAKNIQIQGLIEEKELHRVNAENTISHLEAQYQLATQESVGLQGQLAFERQQVETFQSLAARLQAQIIEKDGSIASLSHQLSEAANTIHSDANIKTSLQQQFDHANQTVTYVYNQLQVYVQQSISAQQQIDLLNQQKAAKRAYFVQCCNSPIRAYARFAGPIIAQRIAHYDNLG